MLTKEHNPNRKIGFHVKNLDELKRFAKMPGVNLAELKPWFWTKDNKPLYTFEKGVFKPNKEILKQVRDISQEHDIQIQIHPPYESSLNPELEEGLCQAVEEHWQPLLDRFKMFGDIQAEYGIINVTTIHPPNYMINGQTICDEETALIKGNAFYAKLDKLLLDLEKQGCDYKIGVENMSDPNHLSGALIGHAAVGYNIIHLKRLLRGTEKLGLTVDAGHRLLSKEMSVSQMFALRPIENLHFHSNPGKTDEHTMATEENLKYFNIYIDAIRAYRIPVVCEVANLDQQADHVLIGYVQYVRDWLH